MANGGVGALHDRMPVIYEKTARRKWLWDRDFPS
jgi:hypothetical protein